MKEQRQNKIIKIITDTNIETQEELAKALNDAGFNVTQATVSRDIKELQLIKLPSDNGKSFYALTQADRNDIDNKMTNVMKHAFVSSDYANNMVVLKTLAGMGQAVGAAIDCKKIQGLIGTIAGDDTLLMIFKHNEDAEYFSENIAEQLKR